MPELNTIISRVKKSMYIICHIRHSVDSTEMNDAVQVFSSNVYFKYSGEDKVRAQGHEMLICRIVEHILQRDRASIQQEFSKLRGFPHFIVIDPSWLPLKFLRIVFCIVQHPRIENCDRTQRELLSASAFSLNPKTDQLLDHAQVQNMHGIQWECINHVDRQLLQF